MKLNNKRTFLIGLAFFSICAFWQAYDFVIPLILKHRFSLGDDIAGFVMALDNILALFLLPLFGTLSDRCQSRLGKRMPFIVAGTVAASALMIALPFADLAGRLGVFIVLLGLLLIAPMKAAAKGLWKLTKAFGRGCKRLIVGRRKDG